MANFKIDALKELFYCFRKRLRGEDQQTFDTLCLHDENEKVVAVSATSPVPKKSWNQMHDEFYAEPPKNPGKILLLVRL